MADFIIKIWEYMERKLGKRTVLALRGLIIVGIIVFGGLSLAQFTIEKLDWLSKRFDIQILPTTVHIINFAQLFNALGTFIFIAVMFIFVAAIVSTPFLLFGYLVLDNTQRGKAEYLIKSAKAILNKVPSTELNQAEIQEIIKKLTELQDKKSWFRYFQNSWGRQVKSSKKQKIKAGK